MTPSGNAWFGHRRPLGFCSKMAVLTGALAISFLPVAWVAFSIYGRAGGISAIAAWSACLIAGLNGLGIATLLSRRSPAVAVLGGMFVRMGLPLLFVLVLVLQSHPLLESGFAFYLIAFYQVMLFVELLLILPDRRQIAMGVSKHHGMKRHGG